MAQLPVASCQLPHCPTPRLSPSRPLKMHPKPGVLRTVSLPPTAAWPSGPHARPALPCPGIINHDVSALTHLSDRQPRRPLRRRLRTVPIVRLCPCNENVFEKALRLTSASTRCGHRHSHRLRRRRRRRRQTVLQRVDCRQSRDAQRAIGRHV